MRIIGIDPGLSGGIAILDDLKSFNETIYMHAQSEVIPFYEKMGFIKEGIEFKEAGIMHYKMILKH